MKVIEINDSDLVGRAFNGFDLHIELKNRGIDAKQIVLDKRSQSDSVIQLKSDILFQQQIFQFEKEHSVHNLIAPYDAELERLEAFQSSDILHYHILHNGMISLFSYPRLIKKNCIWTIHDPWIITGNCVHPLNCEKWKSGCGSCQRLDEAYFEIEEDNTHFMWQLKKKIFQQINPYIVVSTNFMKTYLENSPLTKHFNKIQLIPFGVNMKPYELYDKAVIRKKKKIPEDKIIIGFRADHAPIKGCKYLYNALRRIEKKDVFYLLAIGTGQIPEDIRLMYRTMEFGWLDNKEEIIEFYTACDIFVMPSLAESFGVMAIEAMAGKNVVISFKGTVLEEVTNAPKIGVSVEYRSESEIANKLMYLAGHTEEREWRAEAGFQYVNDQYSFHRYVNEHVRLYKRIMRENHNSAISDTQ